MPPQACPFDGRARTFGAKEGKTDHCHYGANLCRQRRTITEDTERRSVAWLFRSPMGRSTIAFKGDERRQEAILGVVE